jgi:protein TonB
MTVGASLAIHLAIVGIGVAAGARVPRYEAKRVIMRVARPPPKPSAPIAPKEPDAPPPESRAPPQPRPSRVSAPVTPRAVEPSWPSAVEPFPSGILLHGGGDEGVAVPARAAREETPAQPSPSVPAPRTRVLHDASSSGDDGCERPIEKPRPFDRPSDIEYDARARGEGVEGRLVLKITISADGTVEDVEVMSSVDRLLDESAVKTVRAWRFVPAKRCGKATRGTYTLARRFELGD